MEIVSKELTAAQLLAEIPAIVEAFRHMGLEELTVVFGWASGCETDRWWQPRFVTSAGLESFIRQHVEERIFLPGNSDLHICDRANIVEFLLCHESDIHLRTEDAATAVTIGQAWDRKGYRR
jgi:hypothetical protein